MAAIRFGLGGERKRAESAGTSAAQVSINRMAAFDAFETAEVATGEATIFLRRAGIGPPLLLLHGFPETHLMWRGVAPQLAADFTVVCADLRGYGASSCPPSQPDHAPYAKRAMAEDMVALMEHLGFRSFSVAGHDRGGRVAYRLALDHPARIERCAVLDVVTVADAWDRADRRFALGYWPWSLLAQPAPLPERLLSAAPDAVIDDAIGAWGSAAEAFAPQIRAVYIDALRDPPHVHAICEEYRSAATLDYEHDCADRRSEGRPPHRLPGAGAMERSRWAGQLVRRSRRPARAMARLG
jgi:haloacetate dehalogenase